MSQVGERATPPQSEPRRALALVCAALMAALAGGCETAQESAPPVSPAPAAGAPTPGSATGDLLASMPPPPSAQPEMVRIEGTLLEGLFREYLTISDVERAQRAAIAALEGFPSGQTRRWRNPENGHWGTLTPLRTYVDAEGRYCREYVTTVTIGGLEHQGRGMACRAPEGVWRVAG